MIRNINSIVIKGLKILGKLSVLSVQIVTALVSDEKNKTPLTAMKAEQLYEDEAISGSEFSKHIHPD